MGIVMRVSLLTSKTLLISKTLTWKAFTWKTFLL